MIVPLPPAQSGRRGGRWRSHRQVIDAVLRKERTDAPWRDLLERYGRRAPRTLPRRTDDQAPPGRRQRGSGSGE
ncbi:MULTISPECIES: hypothetical protein [Actinosynnema]|uniref:hypothetical protein n=1 Tax=Actinosynnema TaxID=40566 RepID=UPI003557EAAD